MKFHIPKFHIPGRRNGSLAFSREDIIVWGVMLLSFFLASVIFWDGYIFYQTIVQEREKAVALSTFEEVSPKDIDEVIRLLDERERKFKEILGR